MATPLVGVVAAQLRALFAGIDDRSVPLEIVVPPTFCGDPTYRAAGWTICVFDDCGEWDYIEWVESPKDAHGECERYETFGETHKWDGARHVRVREDTEIEVVLEQYTPAHEGDWGYE